MRRRRSWPFWTCASFFLSLLLIIVRAHQYYCIRRTRLVEDVLTITTAYEERDALHLDKNLLYPGREQFWEEARMDMNAYNADVRVRSLI